MRSVISFLLFLESSKIEYILYHNIYNEFVRRSFFVVQTADLSLNCS